MRVSIQSLGCPKNFVDSEVIGGCLLEKNHALTNQIEGSDIVIINTCSFIKPAVEESIDAILRAAKLKEKGLVKYIIVSGCLPQRYSRQELEESLPEVDAFIGVDQIEQVDRIVEKLSHESKIFAVTQHPCLIYNHNSPRFLMTPGHYAYLKIAEGCNNACTYCLIPKIKGRYRSRSIPSILAEVENLHRNYSIKEIILIAEDTTYYGVDLYGKPSLAVLLKEMLQLPWNDDQKIRILYTHPASYDNELIDIIAQNPVICPYLDLPLQHISDKILKSMNRRIQKKEVIGLLEKLRDKIAGLTLRTTFIVGFPGETDHDFQELFDFVSEFRFERMGAFPFYNEAECAASKLENHVSEKIKKERLKELMKLQQKISLAHQSNRIGKEVQVLVDGVSGRKKKIFRGRSCAEAPEIDGDIVLFNAENQDVGNWVNVKITKAYPYRLEGEKIG
ncbi:MAG: 30S ribosomal protein S12 methylthiotransferase RimO [Candidatus Atribacteria bacterium]|nr:30S ribosomal protein S12 methylthiotransferase RimO [Candidatus Atribacteria bacterium]